VLHANAGQTPLEILKQLELHNESVVLFLVDQHVPDMNGACLTGGIWLCWLLVISARSIRPLSAPSHVSRRLPIPQMKSTIKMHSSDYPIIFKKGSRTLCMGFLPSSSG